MQNNYVSNFFRGGSFRCAFDEVGDIRALVPSRIKMMALTATATKTLRQEICHVLGMFDYVLVENHLINQMFT